MLHNNFSLKQTRTYFEKFEEDWLSSYENKRDGIFYQIT